LGETRPKPEVDADVQHDITFSTGERLTALCAAARNKTLACCIEQKCTLLSGVNLCNWTDVALTNQ
jgi:hypothetical protein